MKGESLTFITRSGEDIWKTMGIVEVMQRSGQFVPPEIQQMVDGHLARQARVATKILGEGCYQLSTTLGLDLVMSGSTPN